MARRARTRSRRPRPALRWLAAGAFAFIALAYYKPVRSYFETRHALAGRAAEVRALERERARLRRRLSVSTSEAALARQARRVGYVKPGETLFIVNGISSWRHRARARGKSASGRSED
ncbi:MAG: septum formation initiator family protein [Actinomycetota bacterium]|nr:septum formation initiator family protein [Actinomycetota bacterium]